MKKINLITSFILTVISVLVPLCFIQAQSNPIVNVKSDYIDVAPGSLVSIKVLVSSEQELNAFNININYSQELFSFERSYTENSVASLWKTMPILDEEDGNISLIGGSSQPWSGNEREIVTLMFKARREGTSSFIVKSASFALSDGLGTQLGSDAVSRKVAVSNTATRVISNTPVGSPRIAGVSIVNDPSLKNPMMILETNNPGSIKWLGVRSRDWVFWNDWQRAQLVSSVPLLAWSAQIRVLGHNGEEITKTFYRWDIIAIKSIAFILLFLITTLFVRWFKRRRNKYKYVNLCFLVFFSFLSFLLPQDINAASLSISPSSGTFSVGSTFDIKILLNTEGQEVNALDIKLKFPVDMLQVVSPSAGQSIIDVWVSPPRFDNLNGQVILQGGIPRGINVSQGLVSTITFRVKKTGRAILNFLENSRVLLNDGKGTNDLQNSQSAVLQFTLPPPAGPTVVSPTHPDQNEWYVNSDMMLHWTNFVPVEGYSYALNDIPIFNLDNIIDGREDSVSYKNLSSGKYYFHIKSFSTDGVWGGTTHYAINIDADKPAVFPVDVKPSSRTSSNSIFLYFNTTDAHSGIERYEIATIPLDSSSIEELDKEQSFFIEAISPEVIDLKNGKYDIVVRAYDRAGNFTESVERVKIMTPFALFATSKWVIIFMLLLVAVLAFVLIMVLRWHKYVHHKHIDKLLPERISKQLNELKNYRKKYGHLILILGLMSNFFIFSQSALAQPNVGLVPPYISTISKNISNNDIFYVGGKTIDIEAQIIIYMQNLISGETLTFTALPDRNGNWFYRHNSFLSSGDYLLWTQAVSGELMSPPSSQAEITVNKTAVQFGANRLSSETLYLIFTIILLLILTVMIGLIIFYFNKGRKKHVLLQKEIKEAEESLKRGFAVIRRDIQSELAVIGDGKIDVSRKLKEEHLLKDLEEVEKYIGKEIWDIEKNI